jgi:NAD-dependent SIR2 family protein deacetylase
MRLSFLETVLEFHGKVNTMAEAYCVKCKAKKEMANAQQVTMKNGRPAVQGVCPDCGTKLFRIMGGKK